MPSLVSMKVKADEEQDYKEPAYGYGLCLYFDEEQLKKLGISSPYAVGTSVNISAKAIVESISERVDLRGDGRDISMVVQITDLLLEKGEVVPNAAAILYPDMD